MLTRPPAEAGRFPVAALNIFFDFLKGFNVSLNNVAV